LRRRKNYCSEDMQRKIKFEKLFARCVICKWYAVGVKELKKHGFFKLKVFVCNSCRERMRRIIPHYYGILNKIIEKRN
jgi:hypothetical protein